MTNVNQVKDVLFIQKAAKNCKNAKKIVQSCKKLQTGQKNVQK